MAAAPIGPNETKWLTLLKYAEGTYRPNNPAESYRIMFGGGKFNDLSRHPDIVNKGGGYESAAAGAYQFMPKTWKAASQRLGLRDFSPASQDLAALDLIRRRGVDPARDPINAQTIAKLAPEWASLPTLSGKSYWGQPVKPLNELLSFASSNPQSSQGSGAMQPAATPQTKPTVDLPPFDFKGAMFSVMQDFASGLMGQDQESPQVQAYLDLADKADAAGNYDEADAYLSAAERLKDQMPDVPSLASTAMQKLLGAQLAGSQYNEMLKKLQDKLNQPTSTETPQQTQPTQQQGALPRAGAGLAYPGTIITSAKDVSGEPGSDFVIPGGRGAWFRSPAPAQVLRVTRGQGPSAKGYGNVVELRINSPFGPFDTTLAHFDEVNPALKPGMVVSEGTPLGTQGQSGRTTGPHVSMDLWTVGKNTADPAVLSIRDAIVRNLQQGKPIFSR